MTGKEEIVSGSRGDDILDGLAGNDVLICSRDHV